ncbi:MAG: helix-turn-helix transcriptional regulator, partial [Pseudomonadota bacterium]
MPSVENVSGIIDQGIGEAATKYREKAGISIEEASDRVGVDVDDMEAMEAGSTRIPAKTLYDLSTLYSVDIEAFYEKFGIETPTDYCEASGEEIQEMTRIFISIRDRSQRSFLIR